MHFHKYRLIIFFAFIVLHHVPSVAQDTHFQWVKTMGAPGRFEYGISMVINHNKSIITVGNFSSTVDFDGGPGVFNMASNGRQDIYITEYDSSGNFKWAKQIGGPVDDDVFDIEMDSKGNIYILGAYQQTVDLDPGPGEYKLTTVFAQSFLLKLDNNGNFTWVKLLPYGSSQLEIDRNDNIILGGEFGGTKDFDPGPGTYLATNNLGSDGYTFDMFVLKLDKNADFVWMRQIRNLAKSLNQQFGLKTDVNNDILFAGNYTDSMDFDPGPSTVSFPSAGINDAFILKLDRNGNFDWVKHFGGPGDDKPFDLTVDRKGNVYTTGAFFYTADFDPGPGSFLLTSPEPDHGDFFISKLDHDGNFVYAKAFETGSSYSTSVAVDSSDNVYAAGYFLGAVDVEPGPGTYTVSPSGIFTIKFDSIGNYRWTAVYNNVPGSPTSGGGPTDLEVDILKNVYLAGEHGFTVDFDPGPAVYPQTAAGLSDIFIHKLSQCNNSLHIIDTSTCSSYTLNNVTYTTPGVYFQTYTNSVGCDSIIQLNLASGDKIKQLDIMACESYLWNNKLLTASGTYADTFHLISGCDSVEMVNLTLTRKFTSLDTTVCGSYVFNGKSLSSDGIYRDTLDLPGGCDSVITLHLTVNSVPKPDLGRDVELCKGERMLLSPGSFDNYMWSNNSTASLFTVADTGIYWVTVTNSYNCVAADTIKIGLSGKCIECNLDGQCKIYPNPFRDFLVIDKNYTECEVRMDLFNSIGQLVLKDKIVNDGVNSLPLKILSPGIYFYKFHSDNNILLIGKVLKR